MEILLDEFNEGLREYLLSQDYIEAVEVTNLDYLIKYKIKHNHKISCLIIYQFICLYLNTNYSCLVSFDKGDIKSFKTLNYKIDDICCEYCYKGLVDDLFNNNHIKSVNSDIDFSKPMNKVNFKIEYDDSVSKESIIDYIKEKFN
jgi:copper chaperone CopZ